MDNFKVFNKFLNQFIWLKIVIKINKKKTKEIGRVKKGKIFPLVKIKLLLRLLSSKSPRIIPKTKGATG